MRFSNRGRPVICRFRSHIRAVSVLLLLVSTLDGCTTWVVESGPGGHTMAAKRESTVRITYADGMQRLLRSPRVMRDTVFGDEPYRRYDQKSERLVTLYRSASVPLSQITRVEVRRLHRTRTVLAVGAGATLVLLLMAAASPGVGGDWSSGGYIGGQ